MTDSTNSSIKMPIRRMNVDELDNNTTALLNTQRTNCITEIPQDIKLELLNGDIKVLAGSILYVPDGKDSSGNNIFTKYVVEEDIAAEASDGTATNSDWVLFIHTASRSWRNSRIMANFSGDTAPVVSSTYAVWYDTATNYIKYTNDNGANWIAAATSFPICMFTRTEGTASSIDQIFNGFGYIGSTVFALPGVKGLIANGRNEDGSLKNTEFVTENLLTYTFTSGSDSAYLAFADNGSRISYASKQDWDYDEDANFIIWKNAIRKDVLFAGSLEIYENKITAFNPKTLFQAVDRNDTSWLSGLGMTSDKYVDLTLGNSGSRYIMPANGYILFSKQQAAANEKISLFLRHPTLDNTNILATEVSDARNYVNLKAWLPVPKSGEIEVQYDATGNTTAFRFYYAEGEQ